MNAINETQNTLHELLKNLKADARNMFIGNKHPAHGVELMDECRKAIEDLDSKGDVQPEIIEAFLEELDSEEALKYLDEFRELRSKQHIETQLQENVDIKSTIENSTEIGIKINMVDIDKLSAHPLVEQF